MSAGNVGQLPALLSTAGNAVAAPRRWPLIAKYAAAEPAADVASINRSNLMTAPVDKDGVAQPGFAQFVPQPIDRYTRLVPLRDLPGLITELETALQECGELNAVAYCKQLTDAYPYASRSDAGAGYIKSIAGILKHCPDDICKQVVELVTRSLRFLPARAEVAEVAKVLLEKRRGQLATAKAMLVEHEIRQKNLSFVAEQKARREQLLKQHGGRSPAKQLSELLNGGVLYEKSAD